MDKTLIERVFNHDSTWEFNITTILVEIAWNAPQKKNCQPTTRIVYKVTNLYKGDIFTVPTSRIFTCRTHPINPSCWKSNLQVHHAKDKTIKNWKHERSVQTNNADWYTICLRSLTHFQNLTHIYTTISVSFTTPMCFLYPIIAILLHSLNIILKPQTRNLS